MSAMPKTHRLLHAALPCVLVMALCIAVALTACAKEAPAPSGLQHDGSLGSAQPSANSAASDAARTKGDDPTRELATNAQPITITESGWWAKDGYVHYGLMVQNPNEDAVARDTNVHVTCYNADGAITWEQDDTIALIGPGQTVGFAADAGDGWQPARVEFTLDGASTTWDSAEGFAEPFTIEDFEDQDKLYFRYEVIGDIRNNTDEYASTANLSIILRDDAGSIIAGYTGSAYRIKAQRTKDFLVTLQSAPPHARAEVYAQPVEG